MCSVFPHPYPKLPKMKIQEMMLQKRIWVLWFVFFYHLYFGLFIISHQNWTSYKACYVAKKIHRINCSKKKNPNCEKFCKIIDNPNWLESHWEGGGRVFFLHKNTKISTVIFRKLNPIWPGYLTNPTDQPGGDLFFWHSVKEGGIRIPPPANMGGKPTPPPQVGTPPQTSTSTPKGFPA